MEGMRGGITGVGNNGPVNASLCIRIKRGIYGRAGARLQQVSSTFPGGGRGAGGEDNSSSLSSAPGAGRRDWTRWALKARTPPRHHGNETEAGAIVTHSNAPR